MGRYISNTNSYQDNELMMLRMGLAKNKQEFTTVGASTWVLDHDAMVRVRVWGGGGAGNGYKAPTSSVFDAMGGGAGGWAEIIIELTAGSYPITVGAGGKSPKENGGTSSFSNIVSATGGYAGYDGSVVGGEGGSASINSDFKFLYYKMVCGGSGGRGYALKYSSSSQVVTNFARGGGDSGGSSGYYGGGGGGYSGEQLYGAVRIGSSASVGAYGGNASGYGGGGGGTWAGMAGFSGIVVVEWN